MGTDILKRLQGYLAEEAETNHLLGEKVVVRGKILSAEESIGNPQRRDFPLLKGKESLVQAEFKGALGQAFTDSPRNFTGILQDFLEFPLDNNFDRACFVAVLNAVMNYSGKAEKTVHCKNEEPEQCAQGITHYLKEQYGEPKVGIIGFQPALLEACSRCFPVRIADLDPDNIGQPKYGITVESGETDTKDIVEWCDVLLVTGSTLVNNTLENFLQTGKPVIFYGTTIAGAAAILGLNRFCLCGSK
ncbi:MAG: hypothetical protein GXY50_02745 [Syntrophomonadaceae bacterium]|nr:hypothetical protein [Syntrophomonadaceae bacterium]